jgi:PAS domain S-box-containing protein
LTHSKTDPVPSIASQEAIEQLCMRNLLDSTGARIFFKDREGRFLRVSGGWIEAFANGRAPEQIIGKTDLDVFSQELTREAIADEQRIMDTGKPLLAKLEHDTHEGRADDWVQTTKLPLRDESGSIVGIWGITYDVTAHVEAQRALSESRERLEASEDVRSAMFESNPQPMYVHERETRRILEVNNAAVAIYGYSRDELLSMKVTDLVAPESMTSYLASLQARPGVMHVGFRPAQSRRHIYKDGAIVDVEVTSSDVLLDGRACRIASVQDVTERTRAAADLAAARDIAVEASNMKSAFLANISHEIRTPMNGVLGMSALLLDSDLNDDQRILAAHLASSGELMVELINDILDISKIESGQLELEVHDFALRETIEQACGAAGRQASAQGLDFALEIAAALPEEARGDSRRLRQIILNLVSNAVKFTPEGKITVRAEQSGGTESRVCIAVTDTGIGIDASTLDTMFEPFTQADVSTTRTYGGTGLGLAIARELTELMGGTIGAKSELGAGSTFWIELPLFAPVAAGGMNSPGAQPCVAASPAWITPPRVLVVEDGAVNRIVAMRTLERCGCTAEVVSDGLHALQALATQRYDAVLMDCQMPVMDGYEATAELRRRENGGHRTPVVAMTANAMKGSAAKCLAAGMDDYISKPINREQLLDTLRRWIGPPAVEEPRSASA